MSPYLSIIKDSFREAMASRVLWLTLLLITVLLAALVPFHWVSSIGSRLDASDIRSLRSISQELRVGETNDATELQKTLWNAVGAETRKALDNVSQGRPGPHRFIARKELAEDLNKLIESDDFYTPELWEGVETNTRLNELLEKSELSPELAKQRNRLALEAAMPGMLNICPKESVMFRYAKWDLDFLPTMTRSQAVEQINYVIMIVLPLCVGFFGIFAAVLVTAPIIPNMLASGSLNLLLSKPIARPLLFLAKFAGGCSFVFINVCYLVIGILVLLGWRFQEWKPELLWAVPIFLFSFAIFYSVSAVSGLVWRSTVLAIAMTVLFWVACVSVGATRGLMEQLVIVPDRISDVVATENEIFVQRSNGEVGRWNSNTNLIDEIMAGKTKQQPAFMMSGPKYRGMVYDQEGDMLLALSRNWSQADIYASLRVNDWQRELPTKGPKNSLDMFMRDGKPTIVAEDGVYTVSMAKAEEPLSDINIFGLKIPAPSRKDSHDKISSEFERLPSNCRVAFCKATDRIYLQYSGKLKQLSWADSVFTESNQIETNLSEIAALAAGEGVIVLANREDDKNSIHVFAGSDLAQQSTIAPPGDGQSAVTECIRRWTMDRLTDG